MSEAKILSLFFSLDIHTSVWSFSLKQEENITNWGELGTFPKGPDLRLVSH